MTRLRAYERLPLAPGSPEWQTCMTASKVPAALGLSPWESQFSLYHRMVGTLDPVEQTDLMMKGHYLEDGIGRWFADQHPELRVEPTTTWANLDRPNWQAANPDRLCFTGTGDVRNLQIKTALADEHWGEPGTDQIPPGVVAQVFWEMDTLGLFISYVAVLGAYHEFSEYEIHMDDKEMGVIRAGVHAFMDRVERRDPPPIDGHDATYQAIRELHPDIDPTSVEIPADLALQFLQAMQAAKEADKDKRYWAAQVAQHMGSAQWGTHNGERIVSRVGKPGRTPYLRAENGAAAKYSQSGWTSD